MRQVCLVQLVLELCFIADLSSGGQGNPAVLAASSGCQCLSCRLSKSWVRWQFCLLPPGVKQERQGCWQTGRSEGPLFRSLNHIHFRGPLPVSDFPGPFAQSRLSRSEMSSII